MKAMRTVIMSALAFFSFSASAVDEIVYNQEWLEKVLFRLSIPQDDYVNFPEPEYVPQRNRDATVNFKDFFQSGGWTTNQLVNGLIAAYSNNVEGAVGGKLRDNMIASESLMQLSEINCPAALAFITTICTNGAQIGEMLEMILPGTFRYTNLEPEVMHYLRQVCLNTNVYESAAEGVMFNLLDCVKEMPTQYRANATTNVAKFIYFSIMNGTTRDNVVQDYELAKFMPVYSNSIQRITVVNHLLSTVTNSYTVACLQSDLARLQALPTNQLNNVSWLTEE